MFNTLGQIANFIRDLEIENPEMYEGDLFEGWNTWSIIRKNLYFYFKTESSRKKNKSKKIGKTNRVGRVFYLITFITKFFILKFKKNTVLVFGFPNCLLDTDESGGKIDVYLHGFLASEKANTIYISAGMHDPNIKYSVAPYLFLQDILLLFKRFASKKRIEEEKLSYLTRIISKKINNSFYDKEKLFNVISGLLQKFEIESKFYKLFFAWIKPKAIIVVDQVGQPITAAAQSRDIKVIEVQHGFFHKYKPDYYFPRYATKYKSDIPLPNKVLTFGTFYSASILDSEFWDPSKVLEIGSFKIDKYRKNIKETKVNPNRIALVLQPSCFEEWQTFLISLSKNNLESFEFILKPHMGETAENMIWFETFAKENKNFTFLSKESNLMNIMLESSVVVGFHSTALFEALAFQKKVIILNVDSKEFILNDYSIEPIENYFTAVHSVEHFISEISKEGNAMGYQYEKFSKLNYQKNIDNYLESLLCT